MGSDIKIRVIGIGDNGRESVTPAALQWIERAEILFGGERHLEFFHPANCEKVVVKSNLKEVAARINAEAGKKQMVVLASGDPLFYGIGKYLLTKVPKENLELHPGVSSMQLGFAKAKESWEDAVLVSLHAKPMENLFKVLAEGLPKKIGLFTDEENSPDRISQALLDNGFRHFLVTVCENLEGADEKITRGSLSEIAAQKFSALNVMILTASAPSESEAVTEDFPAKDWRFGVPDLEFFQRAPEKGLITKMEVRVVSLARLRISPADVVWDIGAGSGSVAVEAALLAKSGQVYAVEKNAEECANIRKNIAKFHVPHLKLLHALAPEALKLIPDDPDAVFVGGSSGSMEPILKEAVRRLKPGGRLVVNMITLENLSECWQALKNLGLKAELTQLQVSRSQPILEMTRLSALNPIFIVSAEK